MPASGNRDKLLGYEMTMGLRVIDQERYTAYRAEMTPLLEAVGGSFRFDCEVARVLKGGEAIEINRLFVIRFPRREVKEMFFSDPRYVEIRARLFARSVAGVTIIAEYELRT